VQHAALHPIIQNTGFRSLSFAARDTVYDEETEAGPLFRLIFGSIGLSKLLADGRRQIVELLGPGDVFGFTTNGLHETTAQALGNAEVAVYEKHLLRMSPVLHIAMLERLGSQVCNMHALSLALGRKSARERVATFLLILAERFSVSAAAGQNTATVGLCLRRQETADLLGLSLETVSREFTSLRRLGVLSYDHRGAVCINRLSSLRRLSGDSACDA
jgi:CRP-like cAMP-binding protein